LGLGLYIASEIARAHGGMIDVSSTAELTTFTVRIPLAKTFRRDDAMPFQSYGLGKDDASSGS
jgi:nitrogen-specific signal transduction histidine kinase